MSTHKQGPTSRLLRFLKTKVEPGCQGHTIKKADSGVLTGENIQEAPRILSSEENSTFPREYCNPLPLSESYMVGEVRKISYNGNLLDFTKAREQSRKTAAAAAAAQPECAIDTESAADSSGNSEKPPALAARSDTPAARIVATRTDVHTQLVSNGVNGKQRPQLASDLLLGQQDPTSPYFTRRYFSVPYVAAAGDATEPPGDVLHHLSELDAQAFEVYQTYTNTGRVGFKCPADVKSTYMWVVCWSLMNAHILGCIIEEPAFADRVMDILAEKLPLGLPPDFKTVEQLFNGSRKGAPDVLKRFVANCFVNAQQRSHLVLNTSNYSDLFRETALQSALWHLAHSPQITVISACKYHTQRQRSVLQDEIDPIRYAERTATRSRT